MSPSLQSAPPAPAPRLASRQTATVASRTLGEPCFRACASSPYTFTKPGRCGISYGAETAVNTLRCFPYLFGMQEANVCFSSAILRVPTERAHPADSGAASVNALKQFSVPDRRQKASRAFDHSGFRASRSEWPFDGHSFHYRELSRGSLRLSSIGGALCQR